MDQKILQNATRWGNDPYFSEADREEILGLLADLPRNEVELTERFYRDLEFGTGGLRAPMGMGQNRMNRYNVRRAAQALANNVKKHFGGGAAVISYDSRNCSKEFAMEAAGVFAANGMKAHVFRALTPTPMLSFAVRHFGARCGVMITASHNPPIYNGFKAFWNDGAQVVPPVDQEIIREYNALTDWSRVKHMDFAEAIERGLAEWTDAHVDDAFYAVIESQVIQDLDLCRRHGSELAIVYTALHGSAEVPCAEAARRLGFANFYSVPSQATPDGNFPTVKSPNPEDPKALALAIERMLASNADIVFGTDPDGDRLGVVVNNRGAPAVLNGNQIGALLIYYVFGAKAARGALPANPLVIKSIVTSPIQNAIVEHFGGTVLDTLTGFKWMAGLLRELEEKGSPLSFVFASEESFGYMPHKESRDKDGVSSLALMSEAALFYKRKSMTLVDALDEIYARFGFFYESLVSLDYDGIAGAEKIRRIMDHFRRYPERVFAGEEIVGTEDYEASWATDLRTGGERPIVLPKSNVLSFIFASGNRLFLRPSGTEPKIKFYTMVRETAGDLAAKKTAALAKVAVIEGKIREICEKV
jgi:phosphoglucomutase